MNNRYLGHSTIRSTIRSPIPSYHTKKTLGCMGDRGWDRGDRRKGGIEAEGRRVRGTDLLGCAITCVGVVYGGVLAGAAFLLFLLFLLLFLFLFFFSFFLFKGRRG